MAKSLLKKKYGNKYRISQGIMQKVQEWPDIKSNNAKALEGFSLFLHECTNTMSVLEMPSELDHVSNIRILVSKLPYKLRDKWRNRVDYIEEVEMRSVKFDDLCDFVDKQARVATNPAYGDISDDKPRSAPNNRGSRSQRTGLKNFATKGKENTDTEKTTSTVGLSSRKRWCHKCENESHSTEVCRALLKRIAEIKKMGLC